MKLSELADKLEEVPEVASRGPTIVRVYRGRETRVRSVGAFEKAMQNPVCHPNQPNKLSVYKMVERDHLDALLFHAWLQQHHPEKLVHKPRKV